MSVSALRRIPAGTAYWVEAHSADPVSAVRLALVALVDETTGFDIQEVTVSSRLINPEDNEPYEAVAFASIVE